MLIYFYETINKNEKILVIAIAFKRKIPFGQQNIENIF